MCVIGTDRLCYMNLHLRPIKCFGKDYEIPLFYFHSEDLQTFFSWFKFNVDSKPTRLVHESLYYTKHMDRPPVGHCPLTCYKVQHAQRHDYDTDEQVRYGQRGEYVVGVAA